jgi:hypothetical protein
MWSGLMELHISSKSAKMTKHRFSAMRPRQQVDETGLTHQVNA